MAERTFPISPKSTSPLEPGDLIGVPCEPSGWACLQVIQVKSTGPGARTTFVAGVLPWRSESPPTASSTSGLAAVELALVPIELFTDGGLVVHDAGKVIDSGLDSPFDSPQVGTKTKVWGWRSAVRHAQAVAP